MIWYYRKFMFKNNLFKYDLIIYNVQYKNYLYSYSILYVLYYLVSLIKAICAHSSKYWILLIPWTNNLDLLLRT